MSKTSTFSASPAFTSSNYIWPKYTLLPVEDLQIDDDAYQRFEVPSLIDDIAKKFDPLYFGVITVGIREDDSKWVTDGQQRVKAMRKRGDVRLVPCLTFKSKGRGHEADVFIAQDRRRKISALALYKASIVAGQQQALDIQGVLRHYELEVASERLKKPEWPYLSCIGRLRSIHSSGGVEVLDRDFEFIVRFWEGQTLALREEFIWGVDCFLSYVEDLPQYDIKRVEKTFGNKTATAIYSNIPDMTTTKARNGFSRGINMANEFIMLYNGEGRGKLSSGKLLPPIWKDGQNY